MTGSLGRIAALAWTGHRQAVRDRVLLVLACACGAFVIGSVIVSQLTVGERGRIVMDLGLSSIGVLTLLTGTFIAVNQASRDIERRTIDTILSKPVARWELVVGRFAGVGMTVGLMTGAMMLLHSAILVTIGAHDAAMWKAAWLGYVSALLGTALALFVSSFATPLPAQFITLGCLLIGHTSKGLALLADRVDAPLAQWLLRLLYVAVPHFDQLNFGDQVVWHVEIPWAVVLRATVYGLSYAGLLVVLTAGILSRRDLA